MFDIILELLLCTSVGAMFGFWILLVMQIMEPRPCTSRAIAFLMCTFAFAMISATIAINLFMP